MNLPHSVACERNRDPILAALHAPFADRRQVLEIGSGTGQHAVHLAAAMPWLRWQCSDVAANLPGICAWLDAAQLPNTPPPIEMEFDDAGIRALTEPGTGVPAHGTFDAVFMANTLHIASWPQVQAMFAGMATLLAADARVAVYGPFHRNGRPTGPGNAQFDQWLRARDPRSGLRDLEAVDALARAQGLRMEQDIRMPADNAMILWRREQAQNGCGSPDATPGNGERQ